MSQLDQLIDLMLDQAQGKISLENLDLKVIESLILIKAEIDALKKEIRDKNEHG